MTQTCMQQHMHEHLKTANSTMYNKAIAHTAHELYATTNFTGELAYPELETLGLCSSFVAKCWLSEEGSKGEVALKGAGLARAAGTSLLTDAFCSDCTRNTCGSTHKCVMCRPTAAFKTGQPIWMHLKAGWSRQVGEEQLPGYDRQQKRLGINGNCCCELLAGRGRMLCFGTTDSQQHIHATTRGTGRDENVTFVCP